MRWTEDLDSLVSINCHILLMFWAPHKITGWKNLSFYVTGTAWTIISFHKLSLEAMSFKSTVLERVNLCKSWGQCRLVYCNLSLVITCVWEYLNTAFLNFEWSHQSHSIQKLVNQHYNKMLRNILKYFSHGRLKYYIKQHISKQYMQDTLLNEMKQTSNPLNNC